DRSCRLVAPQGVAKDLHVGLARLVVTPPAEPNRYLILDFLPTANGKPSSTNYLMITITAGGDGPPKVASVAFRGRVRCYLWNRHRCGIDGQVDTTSGVWTWKSLALVSFRYAHDPDPHLEKYAPDRPLSEQPRKTLEPAPESDVLPRFLGLRLGY